MYTAPVDVLKLGEFIRRTPNAKKTYQRGPYDRTTKDYALYDCDDISREIRVKGSARVWIGFDY